MKITKRLLSFFMALVMAMSMCSITAKAADGDPVGPVDIKSIQKYATKDNWSYDPATKTLTLAGVNIDATHANGRYSYTENENHKAYRRNDIDAIFDLEPGTTVVVKDGTVNTLSAKNGGKIFNVHLKDGTTYPNGIVIKGGGTLEMKKGSDAVYSEVPVKFEGVKVNYTNGGNLVTVNAGVYEKNFDSDINIIGSTVNVSGCSGGIVGKGGYVKLSSTAGQSVFPATLKPNKVIVNIKDSDVAIKVNSGLFTNRQAILVRHGMLITDNSKLDLEAPNGAVVVWNENHLTDKETSIISLANEIPADNAVVAAAKKTYTDGYIHGETFALKGNSIAFSFSKWGFESFETGHDFTNALNTVKINPSSTVTFDACGGSAVAAKAMVSRTAIGTLPVSKKTGYTFKGWSTVKNAAVANVTAETIIAKSIILYAVWEKYYPPFSSVSKTITTTNTDKKDPKGSEFGTLRLKAVGGNKKISLSWSKVSGAEKYIIYGSACGSKLKKIKTIKGTKYTVKKLKKGKFYKYLVVAVKGEKALATSKSAHATTNGGKYGNPTEVSLKKTKVTVKKGKTLTLKPTIKSKKTLKVHIAKVRYESTNKKIATVSSKGKIKGVSKGKCYVYVYAQNGVCKKVKVTVK